MDLEYLAGLSNEPTKKKESSYTIEENSIVKYIILSKKVSSLGQSLRKEAMEEMAKSDRLLGKKTIVDEGIYEDIGKCGVEYKCLALSYKTSEKKEVILATLPENGNNLVDNEIKLQGSPEIFKIDQLPPDLAYYAVLNKEYPQIYYRHFRGGEDRKESLSLCFTPAFPGKVNDPILHNSNQVKMGNGIIMYKRFSPEIKEKALDNLLARQYLMYRYGEHKEPIYHSPVVGMIGYTFVTISKKGFYNFASYGYNRDAGEEQIFTENLEVEFPSLSVIACCNNFALQLKDDKSNGNKNNTFSLSNDNILGDIEDDVVPF